MKHCRGVQPGCARCCRALMLGCARCPAAGMCPFCRAVQPGSARCCRVLQPGILPCAALPCCRDPPGAAGPCSRDLPGDAWPCSPGGRRDLPRAKDPRAGRAVREEGNEEFTGEGETGHFSRASSMGRAGSPGVSLSSGSGCYSS